MSKPTLEELAKAVRAAKESWDDSSVDIADSEAIDKEVASMVSKVLEPEPVDHVAEMRFAADAYRDVNLGLSANMKTWANALETSESERQWCIERVKAVESQREADGQRIAELEGQRSAASSKVGELMFINADFQKRLAELEADEKRNLRVFGERLADRDARITELEQQLAAAEGARDGALHRAKVIGAKCRDASSEIALLERRIAALRESACDREEAAADVDWLVMEQQVAHVFNPGIGWAGMTSGFQERCRNAAKVVIGLYLKSHPPKAGGAVDRLHLAAELQNAFWRKSGLSLVGPPIGDWLNVADTAIAACQGEMPIGAIVLQDNHIHVFATTDDAFPLWHSKADARQWSLTDIIDHRKEMEVKDGD